MTKAIHLFFFGRALTMLIFKAWCGHKFEDIMWVSNFRRQKLGEKKSIFNGRRITLLPKKTSSMLEEENSHKREKSYKENPRIKNK